MALLRRRGRRGPGASIQQISQGHLTAHKLSEGYVGGGLFLAAGSAAFLTGRLARRPGLGPGRGLEGALSLAGEVLVEGFRLPAAPLDIVQAGLLLGCQRCQLCLELQGLPDIVSIAVEGVDAFAFLDAEGILLGQVIDPGQLIGPFLTVVPAGQLLQDRDLVLVAAPVGLDDLVLENVAFRVVGIELHILIIVGERQHVIIQFQFQLAHGE